jgi:4-amino-4-deoxy-L-arabinose transferase-like glycosyltransferase
VRIFDPMAESVGLVEHVNASMPKISEGLSRGIRALAWPSIAFGVALLLFTRFNIEDMLSRDESIYVYAAQQQTAGVPPYVSIFDPKAPIASWLATAAIIVGRALDISDVYSTRVVYLLIACLAVSAMYILAKWLFASTLAGIAAAATLASFQGFARDALTGPDAKTPAVLFSIVTLGLLVRRRYFLSGLAASLALLTWQPLAIYAVIAVVFALTSSDRDRRMRAVGSAFTGIVIPLGATAIYYATEGALADLYDATIDYPLTGVESKERSNQLQHIASVVNRDYPTTKIVFWAGLAILLALAVARAARPPAGRHRSLLCDPYLIAVIPAFIAIFVFSLTDFQGYPDVYPLLPFSALGIGAGFWLLHAATVNGHFAVVAAALSGAAIAAMVVASFFVYSRAGAGLSELTQQRQAAAALNRLLGPDDTMISLGNPMPLVLTQRANPSPFIYLEAGVDQWAIDHRFGTFANWTKQIEAANPAVVVLARPTVSRRWGRWISPVQGEMRAWLAANYVPLRVRGLPIFATPSLAERVRANRNRHTAGEPGAALPSP